MIPNQDRCNNDSCVATCNEVTVPRSQPSKSPKQTLSKESQKSYASINKANENEVKLLLLLLLQRPTTATNHIQQNQTNIHQMQ
jgi:hypothetical protein